MGAVGAQFIAPTLVREASDNAEPQIWTATNVTAQQAGVSSTHRGFNGCPDLIVQFFTDLMGVQLFTFQLFAECPVSFYGCPAFLCLDVLVGVQLFRRCPDSRSTPLMGVQLFTAIPLMGVQFFRCQLFRLFA